MSPIVLISCVSILSSVRIFFFSEPFSIIPLSAFLDSTLHLCVPLSTRALTLPKKYPPHAAYSEQTAPLSHLHGDGFIDRLEAKCVFLCVSLKKNHFLIVCPLFGLSVIVSPLMSAYSLNRIINRAPLTFQFAP